MVVKELCHKEVLEGWTSRALANERADVPVVWTNQEPLRCAEQSTGPGSERAESEGRGARGNVMSVPS